MFIIDFFYLHRLDYIEFITKYVISKCYLRALVVFYFDPSFIDRPRYNREDAYAVLAYARTIPIP